MPRTLDYSILDVFAEAPLTGNPLAVFHDARTLTDAEMQALARETNLAETSFILPAEDSATEVGSGVRVRIFTVEEELPFAGHPTLGTATWLYLNHPHLRGVSTITLQLNVGSIAVTFPPQDVSVPGVIATMAQHDPIFGVTHDPAAVARALGLQPHDLSPTHPPQTVSTGLPFCIVPLRSLQVAARLHIAQRDAQAFLAGTDARFFYCIAPTGAAPAEGQPHWHARMQFYNGEDPATGSAAGCCISWLVRHGLAAPGALTIIEQGVEMLRPSRIVTAASIWDNRVSSVLVSGRTIPVAQGRFFLP